MKSTILNSLKKLEGTDVYLVCSGELECYRASSFQTKEPETVRWIDLISKYIRATGKRCSFYDVGANIGVYSLYAASMMPTASIFCFEPEISNFKALLGNVLYNGFTNISPFNCGVSDGRLSAACKLEKPDDRVGNSGAQLVIKTSQESSLSGNVVLSFGIDQLIGFGIDPPNFVKIDVDGLEASILKGMLDVLRLGSIDSLLVEFNGINEEREWTKHLSELGYERDTVLENLENHSTKRRLSSGNSARNVIFVRRGFDLHG